MTLIRRYRASDHGAVIALFRGFIRELTPPHLASQFEAYVETAIREELGRIEDYYLARRDQGFWVAEDNVLGMVGIERHAADAGEVRRMAVDRARRRRGTGRQAAIGHEVPVSPEAQGGAMGVACASIVRRQLGQ